MSNGSPKAPADAATMAELRSAHRRGELDKQQYISSVHALHRRLFEYAEFLRDSDAASIEIVDGEVVVTSRSRGVRLRCDPEDEHLIPFTLMNFGTYESAELDCALALVTPGDCIFDVGANCGWYAINFAKHRGNLDIHCFEPMAQTSDTLRRNLELNAIEGVHVHTLGIGDEDGEREFFYTPACSGGTSMERLAQPGEVVSIRARVQRLDTFCSERDVSPSFIKCDVEGAELMVVRGALETIDRHHPVIFLELLRKWAAKFDYHPNEVIELLAAHGYRCFAASATGLAPFERMDDTTVETNFFFLHAQDHRRQIRELGHG